MHTYPITVSRIPLYEGEAFCCHESAKCLRVNEAIVSGIYPEDILPPW